MSVEGVGVMVYRPEAHQDLQPNPARGCLVQRFVLLQGAWPAVLGLNLGVWGWGFGGRGLGFGVRG